MARRLMTHEEVQRVLPSAITLQQTLVQLGCYCEVVVYDEDDGTFDVTFEGMAETDLLTFVNAAFDKGGIANRASDVHLEWDDEEGGNNESD